MISIFILFGKINAAMKLCSEVANKTGTACIDRNCVSIDEFAPLYCECKEGYIKNINGWCVHPDDLDCFDLMKNCDKCDPIDKKKCGICSEDYYLTLSKNCEKTPFCFMVIEHCSKCDYHHQKFHCLECDPDYEVDYNGLCVPSATSNCLDTVENCVSCKEDDKFTCTECKEGLLLNYVKNKCIEEREINCFYNQFYDPNCDLCDSFNKTKCGVCGYKNSIFAPADNGTCVLVRDMTCKDILANCESCADHYCKKCKPHYVPVMERSTITKVLKCIHINEAVCTDYIFRCVECDAKNKSLCTKCDPGYKPSEDQMSCEHIKCDLDCCLDCDIEQNCLMLEYDSVIIDNQCFHTSYKHCKDREFCTLCDENNVNCYECEDGYVVENNKCVRRECADVDGKKDRCLKCEGDNNDLCVSCLPGYKINLRALDCMKYQCPREGDKKTKCELCDKDGNCIKCKEGYELINFNCYKVTECPEPKINKCKICDEFGDCVTCFHGYLYNESTYDCDKIKCPKENADTCELCNIYGDCVKCKPDHDLVYNKCFSNICPPEQSHCIKCTSFGDCIQCEEEYFVNDKKCDYHPSHGCLKFDKNGKTCINCDEVMGFAINEDNICIKLPNVVGPEIDKKANITDSENVILDKSTNTIEIKTDIGELDTSKSYYVDINEKISSVIIDNTKYKISLNLDFNSDLIIRPADGVEEPVFDIIMPSSWSEANLNLPKCKTSIFAGSYLTISSDEESIDIQSINIDGSEKDLYIEVKQNIPTYYKELNAYGQSTISFINVNSESITNIDNVNVEQRADISFANINIKNKLKIGLFAKVSLFNANVADSAIEIDYDDSQKVHIAPLSEYFGSTPKSLKLNRINNNRVLSDTKYFTVIKFDFYNDFCKKWSDFINNNDEKPDPYYKFAVCEKVDDSTELRLVNKIDEASPQNPNQRSGNGLKPGVVAAIVIVCIVVVAAIILVLFFFVFKKRKEQRSSVENVLNDEL